MNDEKKEQDTVRFNKIKAKVLTMGRMSRMLKNVRENSEILAKAKAMSSDGMLPKGILLKNQEDARSDIEQFIKL